VAIACAIQQADKSRPDHRRMALALVEGIEAVLVHGVDCQQAMERFAGVGEQASRTWRRSNRWRVGCLLAVILAIVVLVIVAVSDG
jgi:t-SNARE complex subunit (syntaxin)